MNYGSGSCMSSDYMIKNSSAGICYPIIENRLSPIEGHNHQDDILLHNDSSQVML
jgi:hypothetical protein